MNKKIIAHIESIIQITDTTIDKLKEIRENTKDQATKSKIQEVIESQCQTANLERNLLGYIRIHSNEDTTFLRDLEGYKKIIEKQTNKIKEK